MKLIKDLLAINVEVAKSTPKVGKVVDGADFRSV